MPLLEKWSVILSPDVSPYTPPEGRTSHLHGKCFQHPRYPERDGDSVTTSPIVYFSAEENVARTRSGTEYQLGEPCPIWKQWLDKNGHALSQFNKQGPTHAG